MDLETSIRPLDEIAQWDALAVRGTGGTVFHETWFLRLSGVTHALCVHSGGALVAALPLYLSPDGRSSSQRTRSVPYGGPLLAGAGKDPREDMVRWRAATTALAASLQSSLSEVTFACAVDIHDLVPWIRAGFFPEVRYTYLADVSVPVERLVAAMSLNRRRNLARARSAGVEVVRDDGLQLFDVARAVRWSTAPGEAGATRSMMEEAIARKRGTALVAMDRGEPAGGLFMVWDRRRSYTTHAYHDEAGARLGAATRLYLEAMTITRSALHLDTMDFEGSVLDGIERYYQSFGGRQTLYFCLHWASDPRSLPLLDLYRYR
jgi:hypothetical protein